MEEVWKDVVGYEGHYQVSNKGRVKSLSRKVKHSNGINRIYPGKVLKLSCNGDGYLFLYLSKDGKTKECRVNRLVAEAFIPNPDGLEAVNHKDKNRTNNVANNLEWCTTEYNNRYSIAKHVCQYDLTGRYMAEWEAISDASRELGINCSNITQCCKGNRKTAGGYIWRYKEVE